MSTDADISPDTTSDADSTDPSTDSDTDTGTDSSTDPSTDTGTDTSTTDTTTDTGDPAPDAGTDTSTADTGTQDDTSTPTDTDADTTDTPDTAPSTELSARRSRIIDELLPGVVPSSYGDQRFTALTFGLRKDSPGVTPGYTTCGSLPMYIARKLGDQVITGTFGVRTAGVKKGAWVEAGGDARPKPGDLYALLAAGSTDRAGGGIAHVGVIVDASTDEWKTADAGQGDGWSAAYVTRQYDAAAGTLSGEIVGTTGPRPARVLAGWIDVDAYPFP